MWITWFIPYSSLYPLYCKLGKIQMPWTIIKEARISRAYWVSGRQDRVTYVNRWIEPPVILKTGVVPCLFLCVARSNFYEMKRFEKSRMILDKFLLSHSIGRTKNLSLLIFIRWEMPLLSLPPYFWSYTSVRYVSLPLLGQSCSPPWWILFPYVQIFCVWSNIILLERRFKENKFWGWIS